MNRLIQVAIDSASKSSHRMRVGAVIFRGDRIISTGYNSPSRSVHSINKKFLKWPNSIHAEVDAIIRARCSLRGYDILVVRLSRANDLALAKPCPCCLAYLKHVGIDKIYFSDYGVVKELIQ